MYQTLHAHKVNKKHIGLMCFGYRITSPDNYNDYRDFIWDIPSKIAKIEDSKIYCINNRGLFWAFCTNSSACSFLIKTSYIENNMHYEYALDFIN